MNWLLPIGFLGLLGLAVLVLIYIIKPNYQNKRISSTYIWQRSLKYKKQRIPVSKIQNLLTFICQVLILALLGTLLAGPVIRASSEGDENEAIIIVDASADMRMKDGDSTRFQRALLEARKKAESTLDGGSPVSFILADASAELLFSRAGKDQRDAILGAIDELYSNAHDSCAYSSADIDGAMALAESVSEANPYAGVYLYTADEYTYDNGVEIIDVAGGGEWNAAVLGCTAELDNSGYYRINVRTACYGKTVSLDVHCKIHGANGVSNNTVTLKREGVFFDPYTEEREVVFTSEDMISEKVYSYDYIETYVSVRDSFADDNSYFLYGGRKSVIKIQYASSSPNNFFESAVRSLRESNKDRWDVQYTVLKDSEPYATEGYDFYIFEHKMPDVLPTDGVVLLVDPRTAPSGSDLQIGAAYPVDSSSTLSAGATHDITRYTEPGRITIAKYNDIILAEGYEELMFYNNSPVMLLRDTPDSRVVVWAFDLNYSNLIALPDFSILMYNTFNYFITETFSGNSFTVGQTVDFNGRGDGLKVEGNGREYMFDGAEGSFTPERPGSYTVTQSSSSGKELPRESFFVSVPEDESDVSRTVDVLPFTAAERVSGVQYEDLILWFAIALVVLMFAEWILEIKKNY